MNNDTPKCLESRGSWRNSQSLKHTRGFSKTKTETLRILALYRSTEIPWYGPLIRNLKLKMALLQGILKGVELKKPS